MSKTISVSKSNFSWPSRMDCDAELNKGTWIADLFAIATAGQARAMLLFIALLFSTVSAQSAATDFVRGSFEIGRAHV